MENRDGDGLDEESLNIYRYKFRFAGGKVMEMEMILGIYRVV